MTQPQSSEDVHLSQRFHNDDPELDDTKSIQVALTPPPHALPPEVAQKSAEDAADAEAIRADAARTKQNLWRKVKQADKKNKKKKELPPPGRITKQDEEKEQEVKQLWRKAQQTAKKNQEQPPDRSTEQEEQKEKERKKTGHEEERHRGDTKYQAAPTVNTRSFTRFILKFY